MDPDNLGDNTPRTYVNNGEPPHSGPYRDPDLAQQDLFRRLARLESDVAAQRLEGALLAASRRTWRWIVPTLFTAMLALTGYAVGQISSSAERAGETRTEIKALGKLIDLLETEVSELRRHAGLTGKPISISLGEP